MSHRRSALQEARLRKAKEAWVDYRLTQMVEAGMLVSRVDPDGKTYYRRPADVTMEQFRAWVKGNPG